MSERNRLFVATSLVLVGLLIPIGWYLTLRPFLRGEGPSPGAGAQYVFVLLPSIGLAVITLAVGSAVAFKAQRRTVTQHPALGLLLALLGAFGAIVLAAWLALVVFGMSDT
jgi:hypothetical protein